MKIFKWIFRIAAVLVGLLAIALLAVYLLSQSQLNKTLDPEVGEVSVPADTDSLERGKYLAEAVTICVECHDTDLGGDIVFDDPAIGLVIAPNLTAGNGGIGAELSDQDITRAIRHGIGRDGTRLLIMPSVAYSFLSDEDLGAIITYIRSVRAVDRELPSGGVTILGRAMLLAGALPPFSADLIDHDRMRPVAPPEAVSAEYGEYLANLTGCTDCHTPELTGGPVPGAPPGTPPAPDLTPGGPLSDWTIDDFRETIKSGTTPGGESIDEFMPWKYYANMTDEDFEAIWLYLGSLQ